MRSSGHTTSQFAVITPTAFKRATTPITISTNGTNIEKIIIDN
jgi:hypothetical protein